MEKYTIWISKEKDDDGITTSFDINIWDENNDERVDNLEISYLNSFDAATKALIEIINTNKHVIFTILNDIDNTEGLVAKKK